MSRRAAGAGAIASRSILIVLAALALGACRSAPRDAELASWRTGGSGDRIAAFVERVSDPSSGDYVPADQRIAVFDNDGTLWAEQPVYFQFSFAMDRLREMAPDHPEWRGRPVFDAALAGDIPGVIATGEEGLGELLAATHTGGTPEEFRAIARAWFAAATHPTTGRRFTEMVYQPMLELLDHLRANGFTVYIVTGGGVEFVRAFADDVYGVAPWEVIGSRFVTELDETADPPVLVRRAELAWFNDKHAKPIAIHERLGVRPILAVGNSDGDYQMLRWTTAGDGPRMGVLVHHTDAVREWAYDRGSKIGGLERGLDEADQRGWVLIDMARDWSVVYP